MTVSVNNDVIVYNTGKRSNVRNQTNLVGDFVNEVNNSSLTDSTRLVTTSTASSGTTGRQVDVNLLANHETVDGLVAWFELEEVRT